MTTFGDSSIIEFPLDGSLPFPDESFDIVLAMDVLEHVPENVAGICSRSVSVLHGGADHWWPVNSPEVVGAERAFAELAGTVSGRELEFLAEHVRFGLPQRDDILARWMVAHGTS